MNKVFLALLILLLIGCDSLIGSDRQMNKPIAAKGECSVDADCVTGGCSGTVCQSKGAPPVYTTCVYLPEFDCYKAINCACIEGKCDWEKTPSFEECVLGAKELNAEVVA